ncbi:fumarate hydratase [Methanofollis fontis]|uniref:Fumarate hydratase n=1 Tax=Methanofollis fontis TaxID=2052832 RepID=A0A483CTE3_9EURY|nr:fumarate hydratase [Methanofollis fontis]TAJ44623.1 fumarate hydratase [Methanofollis fontis]
MESTANGFLEAVASATAETLRQAETTLPPDVLQALESALERETGAVARNQLENILENVRYAGEHALPLCQDTGVPVVYLSIPPTVPLTAGIEEAVAEGVRRATREVPLRPNVVDPLSRQNTGDNTGGGMPAIHLRRGDEFSITVLPKGAGAENCSAIAMLLPSRTGDVARFAAETVLKAGGKPCPPVVIGIGIGSTFDGAAALAKEALLEPIDYMTPYEQEICDGINALGIGPMGLGGATTALAVKVRTGHCHTASLPVAVNVQCWAHRRATRRISL